MNKIIFFAITLHAPFLLAMAENSISIGNKRSRNEDFTNEAPPAKKSAVFPLHEACSNNNDSEVLQLLSRNLVNINELNDQGLSPMQCLEASTNPASRAKIALILVMHGSNLPEDKSLRDKIKLFLNKALIEIIKNLNDGNSKAESSYVVLKNIINSELIEHDYLLSEMQNLYNYCALTLRQSLNNESQKGFERVISILKLLKAKYNPACILLAELCLEIICTEESFNKNHIDIAQKLMEFEINFNGSERIFFKALGRKKFDLASLFLESGADIDCRFTSKIVNMMGSSITHIGSTFLHYSIRNLSYEAVKFLLDKGADISAIDDEGNTYLHAICQSTNFSEENPNGLKLKEQFQEIMELLLRKGLGPNIENKAGQTPIMLAPSVEIVDLLLEFGATIELPIVRNISALRACTNGNIGLLKYWQKLGMDFSTVKGENIQNTFFEELYQSHNSLDTKIINYLLEYNFDINGLNNNKMSILMLACYDKPVDHIKWLIDHGADIDHSRIVNGKTETVLHIADKQANIDLLLSRGCTVPEDLLNDDHIKKRLQQKTDLHSAVVAGELEIVQKLLAEGAELWIDVRTDVGEFLIDIASRLANRDIYDLLLSKSKKIPKVHAKSARK